MGVTIKHVLKDGTTVTDITGHIVRMSDAQAVYKLADKMNNERIVRNGNIRTNRKS